MRSNQLSYRPAPRSRARQSQQSCALWARLAALAELGDVRNSSRYFVSRLALNLVMKGHEDGGQCSLEWKKLFLSPKRKALSADILRKEVIQPQVLLRLPCYDFTPITSFTFGGVLLAVRLPTSGPPGSHGVTGGVYKARERIHRSMLICDY